MLAVAEAGGDDYEDADEEWIVYTAAFTCFYPTRFPRPDVSGMLRGASASPKGTTTREPPPDSPSHEKGGHRPHVKKGRRA